jgi:hypothetical protein
MLASRDVRTRTKVATLLASLAVLVTVVQLLAAGSALAASNSVHVKSSKKQITISGVAATAGDSVQVNFDPHKCAASYAQEDKRQGVAFTAFAHQAIHAAGLQRDEVFITTECFNDDHGHEQAKRALKASLKQLEMEFVDLYLINETGVKPTVNQIELHPLLQQAGLRHEHAELGIATEACSPLARGKALRTGSRHFRTALTHRKTDQVSSADRQVFEL